MMTLQHVWCFQYVQSTQQTGRDTEDSLDDGKAVAPILMKILPLSKLEKEENRSNIHYPVREKVS